ncbi:hypothetical protein DVH24_011420 [Malus domestica]|uniref:HMA domain-containing protein n=1 Tax=Malus domestica TaxID=3750 RepID=A0A498JV97_MALDO|nr:hypothetical protein DVH24_011420 [Malus domestica]
MAEKEGGIVKKGHEEGLALATALLQEFGLPLGLLPLADVIEVGFVRATGYMWIVQKKKVEHNFKLISKLVSYDTEIKGYIEKQKIKKLKGVKAKELMLWPPVTCGKNQLQEPCRNAWTTKIVEMIVTMDCAGCENKIRSSLKKLKGVDAVDVDFNMQKVTVTGWADQEKVLRAVRKTGKRAELWPYPYNPEYHNFGLDYYQQHQPLDLNHHHKHHHNRQITTHHLPITTYISVPKSSSSSYSYNYYEHGSTNQDTGYYQPPPYFTMFNEQDTAVFSDDNPHACSIM